MRLPKAVAGINIDGLELIKARKRQSLADWVKTSPSTRRGSGPIVLRVEAIRCRKIPTNDLQIPGHLRPAHPGGCSMPEKR